MHSYYKKVKIHDYKTLRWLRQIALRVDFAQFLWNPQNLLGRGQSGDMAT